MSVIIFRDKTQPGHVQRANNIGKFEVKKRSQYENEVIKCKSTIERVPISYGDRFIPRRQFHTRRFNRKSLDSDENDIFCIKAEPFYWRQHNYRINIGMQLDENDDRNLLNFHDTMTQEMCERSFNLNPTKIVLKIPNRNTEELDWPCKPRSKPLSYSESTHEMPGFDDIQNGYNIVDWSRCGQIAAGFDSSLVLWSPPTKDNETHPIAFDLRHLKALKFAPNGKLLALAIKGMTTSLIEICQLNGVQLVSKGTYRFPKETFNESVSNIEWESTGRHIICGMSTGTILIHSYPGMNLVHRFSHHKVTISNVKYSIHNTFIAITDIDGNLSILRNKPNFELFLEHSPVHYVAWHPWIETNLFIGCKSPASIHLFDLKTKTTIAHYRRNDSQYTLCAMSINPLSAELIVSFSHQVNGITRSDILVMASMNRIVDNISAHQDDVYYILWDPTGTKVATVGRDESLNIWHFFGKSQRKADELKRIQENKKQIVHSHLNLDRAFLQLR